MTRLIVAKMLKYPLPGRRSGTGDFVLGFPQSVAFDPVYWSEH